MENKTKQLNFNLTTSTEIHGQLGPEDLSPNKNSQKKIFNNINNDENSFSKSVQIKNDYNGGLDEILAHQIESVICENSRKTIMEILEEISKLSSTEKLLLYLKLPADVANMSDPLKQPLNPLGSRTEISQTIMWIRTHLEEDPELSLPKQEVYNEYTMHCNNNKMKPLSTADFGKVMKQVYPSVRPRRLGTRGNSRYCYAGLRKRFKLEVPQLPDLAGKSKNKENLVQSSMELNSAAWYIVQKWAENVLGTTFTNVCSLAVYLIKNIGPIISNQNAAAAALLNTIDCNTSMKDENIEVTTQSSTLNLKHKETQIQLQRKLHEREVTREQKRKLQLSVGKNVESIVKSTGGKCKKTKINSEETMLTPQSVEGVPLPNFSSFQIKKQLDSPDLTPKKIEQTIGPIPKLINETKDSDIKNAGGKIAIPRLPNAKMKQVIVSPKPPSQPRLKSRNHHKYKAIQPKPFAKRDISQEGNTQVDTNEVISSIDEHLKDIDYLTRERLISVSNVDKDALDDYLHGGNNSQEQEEELLRYFNNNTETTETIEEKVNENVDDEHSNGSKSDKLSQLRLLLEQNLSPAVVQSEVQRNILVKNEKHSVPSLLMRCNNMSGEKRRVSFETSVLDDTVPPSPNTRRKNFSFTPISPGPHSPSGIQSKPSSTNASPFVSPRNTPVQRAKTICHTVTSYAAQQQKGCKKVTKVRSSVLKNESELFMEQSTDPLPPKQFIPPLNQLSKCNLPMSAPPSPMLTCKKPQLVQNSNILQKLLEPDTKVPYISDYDKNNIQEVGHIISTQDYPTTTFRSQSVPLHQMAPFKTLISPCVPTAPQTQFNFNFDNDPITTNQPTEFTEFETFPDTDMLNNGLNNDNINQILNILDTTQSNPDDNVQSRNVFTFPETNIATVPQFNELPIIQHTNIENQKPVRSQSIEEHIVDLDLQSIRQQKFGQISRSVPSTPLPYNKITKLELNLNNNQISEAFDCEKTLHEEQDYLLNGQPVVKKKFIVPNNDIINESNTFPSSLGFMINENMNDKLCFSNIRVEHNFNVRRNLNSLLEQDFGESNDFTTVPNINSGS